MCDGVTLEIVCKQLVCKGEDLELVMQKVIHIECT